MKAEQGAGDQARGEGAVLGEEGSDEHKGEHAGRAQTYLQHGWEGRKGGLHGNLLQSPARTEENEGGDGSRTEGALS
jgi:hypothetical protein